MQISLEYCPSCAWHMDCPVMHSAPMKWLREYITIEDGSKLRGFECTACDQKGFAGLDARRHCVSRAAPTAHEEEA